jgi:predicted O-methyltransferase YrrM
MASIDSVLKSIESAALRDFMPILPSDQAEYLEWLVRERRPCAAVEIGSLAGYALMRLARNMAHGCAVTGIEIAADVAALAADNLQKTRLDDRARVLVGDAAVLIATLEAPLDLVVLDAARSQYLSYLRKLEPKLSAGATVVACGAGAHERLLRPYLRYVREDARYESESKSFGADALEVSRFLG